MLKLQCQSKTVLFEDQNHERFIRNYLPRDTTAEECLRSLEEWIVKLIDSKEVPSCSSKLRYCYFCVISIRESLKRYTLEKQLALGNDVMTMSENLRSVLLARGYMECSSDPSYSVKWCQERRIFGHICGNGVTIKRKIRRKCRSFKQSRNYENLKKQLDGSIRHQLDMQYLVDQLYVEARSILVENCLHDVTLLNELGGYIGQSETSTQKPLSRSGFYRRHSGKYFEPLRSGECKINGDSQDSFLDSFEKILGSSNTDHTLVEFNNDAYGDFRTSRGSSDRSRSKRDSDFDEGFSENESLEEPSINSVLNTTPEDGDYNSSNSKWSLHSEANSRESCDGDESESDGGTEILNSVNATVDKFNAMMEYSMTTGDDHKVRSFARLRESDVSSLSPSPQVYNDVLAPVPNELSSLPLISEVFTHKNERDDSSAVIGLIPHDRLPDTSSPLSHFSNIDCENMSQMLLPPIKAQNWCSYNCHYAPPRSSNYYYNQSKTYNVNNPPIQNYDIQKLSPWLQCISNSVPTPSSYDMPTNYNTAQLHRILLSPQLTIPSINLGPMQHSFVHLPQIFHQQHQSTFDMEYLDRRYTPVNLNQSMGASHDFLAPSPLNIVSNTNNHSNSSLSRTHLCQSIFKASLDKSQRACCFYMRGGCKKEDCEYAHDLSKVTCKFWEKGDCFKADTCPFKHSYQKI